MGSMKNFKKLLEDEKNMFRGSGLKPKKNNIELYGDRSRDVCTYRKSVKYSPKPIIFCEIKHSLPK